MTSPRRAADRLVNRLTVPPAGPVPYSRCVTATITAVGAGGATDGNALVTVSWNGQTQYATYLSSYTPVVGHVVDCGYNGSELHIHGRLVGTPPEV